MRGTDLIQATVSIFCLHLLLASFSPLSTLLASQSRTELKIKQLRRHTKHKETPTSSFSIFIWFSHSSMQTTRTIPVSPSTANNRALHRNGTAATRIGAEQKGQQRCTTNTSSRALQHAGSHYVCGENTQHSAIYVYVQITRPVPRQKLVTLRAACVSLSREFHRKEREGAVTNRPTRPVGHAKL